MIANYFSNFQQDIFGRNIVSNRTNVLNRNMQLNFMFDLSILKCPSFFGAMSH